MTPGDRIARANRANELLNSGTMKEAFNGVREALVVSLESCAVGDTSTQHEIALMLQLLKRVQAHLQSWVSDGTLAKKEVEQQTWLDRVRSGRKAA